MSPKIISLIVFFTLAILAMAIFANGMTKPLSHDEQMYATAGVLTSQGKMVYRDFSYPGHMPYYPLTLAALFKLFDTNYYLLTARIFSCLCDIITMLCIVFIYRRIFNPYPILTSILSLAAATLYVLNPAVEYAAGYAWNHNITIACVALAVVLFLRNDKLSLLPLIAITALLTFATCIRITTALVELCFLIALLLLPTYSLKQKLKNIFLFFLTAIVVLLYPLYVIAQAPKSFLINLFLIPDLNGQWQQAVTSATSIKTPNIATDPWSVMSDYALLIIVAIPLSVALFNNRRRLKVTNICQPLFIVMLILAFFVIALVPPTTWKQYLAMPVPFIVIAFAFPILYLRKLNSPTAKSLGIVVTVFLICAFSSATMNFSPFQKISSLSRPQTWTAIKLHNIATDIAQNTPAPKKIMTLAPLYALEGGCDIYDQLSAGPFVYRIAQAISPQQLAITNTVAPAQLNQLIPPPSAVILGAEHPALEKDIYKANIKPDWQRKVYDNGIVAYFKP